MSARSRQREVACPGCGERNPARFPTCWSCHRDLPPDLERLEPRTESARIAAPELAVRAPQDRKLAAIELGVVLLLLWLPGLLGGIQWLLDPVASPWSAWSRIWKGVNALGGIALIGYLAARESSFSDGRWCGLLGLGRTPVAPELLWGVALAVAMLVCDLGAWHVGVLLDLPTWSRSNGVAEAGLFARAFLVTPTVPLAALAEELLFRAYVWVRCVQLTRRPWLSVLASAVLFSAVHAYDPAGTLALFLGGVIFGVSFVIHRKLWRLVIAHTLYNLMVVWT